MELKYGAICSISGPVSFTRWYCVWSLLLFLLLIRKLFGGKAANEPYWVFSSLKTSWLFTVSLLLSAQDLIQRVKSPQHLRVSVRDQCVGQRGGGRGGERRREGGRWAAQHGGAHPHPSTRFHRLAHALHQWWDHTNSSLVFVAGIFEHPKNVNYFCSETSSIPKTTHRHSLCCFSLHPCSGTSLSKQQVSWKWMTERLFDSSKTFFKHKSIFMLYFCCNSLCNSSCLSWLMSDDQIKRCQAEGIVFNWNLGKWHHS